MSAEFPLSSHLRAAALLPSYLFSPWKPEKKKRQKTLENPARIVDTRTQLTDLTAAAQRSAQVWLLGTDAARIPCGTVFRIPSMGRVLLPYLYDQVLVFVPRAKCLSSSATKFPEQALQVTFSISVRRQSLWLLGCA